MAIIGCAQKQSVDHKLIGLGCTGARAPKGASLQSIPVAFRSTEIPYGY